MWRLAPPFNKALLTDRRSREHLKLLRGAAIEVCVGEGPCKCSSPETCDCNESWVLPKALISRYSSFLKSACTRDFKERNENRIELPEDDPKVFALFVEWMYYGSYTILAPSILSDNTYDDINMNARCWILGDKLLSTEFKNLAMGRLYTQCMATMFTIGTVTPHDVQYACENSAAGSKLRQFYFSYVVEHFATPMKLKGSTEEWDEVMLHHADLRSVLIKSFRVAPEDRLKVESEKAYMDHDELLTSAFDRLRLEGNSS
ncbi:Nn.00g089390.m01.CDS01 [Neocucurbitaria sp. VM-36]